MMIWQDPDTLEGLDEPGCSTGKSNCAADAFVQIYLAST